MIDAYITGANGFVGQHLMKKLKGVTVPIAHETLDVAFPTEPARTLFFLSTYGNMAWHSDHFETVKANVYDLIWTLEQFQGFIVYMSSSSVTLPVQTSYSRAKRAAEEVLLALPEVKSCIVRPYSVFGRNEQPSHLIPTIIRSCFEGEGMDFAPDPVHDWIAVDDVVDGLILFANNKYTGLFELGSGVARSNVQVLDTVERISGKKANINIVSSLRYYDNNKWVCRQSRAFDIGWSALRDFDDTIKEVIEDYKQSPERYALQKLPTL